MHGLLAGSAQTPSNTAFAEAMTRMLAASLVAHLHRKRVVVGEKRETKVCRWLTGGRAASSGDFISCCVEWIFIV